MRARNICSPPIAGGVRMSAFPSTNIIGVVMLVALTIFLATLIGRIAAGHMWVGALVTGVLELVLAVVLLRRGLGVLREPSYTLEETRAALKDTAVWARNQRS